MKRCIASVALFITVLLVGCSSSISTRPDPVDVVLSVSLPSGHAARDVVVTVFPTSADQMQGGGKTDAGGKLKTKLTPGKHTFAIEGTSPTMKLVPGRYRANDAENQLEIPAGGGDIVIKLRNG